MWLLQLKVLTFLETVLLKFNWYTKNYTYLLCTIIDEFGHMQMEGLNFNFKLNFKFNLKLKLKFIYFQLFHFII